MFPIINSSGVKKNFGEKSPVYICLSSVIIFEEKTIEKKKELHI